MELTRLALARRIASVVSDEIYILRERRDRDLYRRYWKGTAGFYEQEKCVVIEAT